MFITLYDSRLSEPSEDVTIDHDSVAIVRFVHHQLLEMARDCLLKSEERLVTSRYALELSFKTKLCRIDCSSSGRCADQLGYYICILRNTSS